MHLNFNKYTLEYLKLMIEAQEVNFTSNIYEKTSFQDNRVCVCKFITGPTEPYISHL